MSAAIHTISTHAFDDEAASVEHLVSQLGHMRALESAIMKQASTWASTIRNEGIGHGMEAFLQTYGLDTREGVALMCLAEALLRIPDSTTANRLIHDTFDSKDWREHITGDEPWLVGASSWGLWLTGKVIGGSESTITHVLKALPAKLGEPVIREALKQAMRMIGSQFVLGENIQDGLENAKSWSKKGYRFSYDILGEGARSNVQALGYVEAYREAIALIGATAKGMSLFAGPSISVKLSALHPRYSLSQRERVMAELMPRLKEILLQAKEHNITVSIDAEECNRLDIELMLFEQLFADTAFDGWNGIGFVLQAYQKRAVYVVDFLADLAKKHRRIIPVRLVKGAYWDTEVKHAQIYGLPDYPVFTRKEHTDVSYLACADKLLQYAQHFYPQFATHNARTIASIQQLAQHYGIARDQFEFQRLHGMGEKLHDMVVGDHGSRIYAPIGEHKDLLAYLIRRLLENGANTSFVNLLMDADVSLGDLLADPIARAQQKLAMPLPLPKNLYGDRKNSAGFDLGYLYKRAELEQSLSAHKNILKTFGTVDDSTPADVKKAVGDAVAAFPDWAQVSVEKRCQMVETIADLFEQYADELMALLIHEAGKTIPDAISEVREAADFCRFYAVQTRTLMATPQTLTGPTGELNQLALHPRGVFACISPWNFPLAIFVGQIVAALVMGNAVVAKPAEQTPRIAKRAVQLMHEAGIPHAVLQLVTGDGATIGSALTADARMAGVVFTGSVEVAHIINRTLAARTGSIVPFIAETGGQNCMVVDSSALIEQAVDDVILSAFGSAGQRCSALRVLYVQEEIADSLVALLNGAMQELKVNDPSLITTDIGPVIDSNAQNDLQAHIDEMKRRAKLVATAPASVHGGSFVTPHVFEIASLSQLTKEHFGPILHIRRFAASKLQQVADEINASGFGLTFGMHSRIEENIQFFLSRIHAGNRYVNRSMIGAVVGVQPFGGEGLSGTGPKAGGPFYLLKFVHERTTTINTAAIGGNVALMAGK